MLECEACVGDRAGMEKLEKHGKIMLQKTRLSFEQALVAVRCAI